MYGRIEQNKSFQGVLVDMKKISLFAITLIALFFLIACKANEVEFTITFDSNEGSSVQSILSDGKSSIQLPDDPVKEGHVFVGWYWDNVTYQELFTINSLTERGLTSNLTVYAKWILEVEHIPIDSFKVTFDAKGGVSVTPIYVISGSAILMPTVSKEGYTLDGWYTSLNNGDTLDEQWSFTNNTVINDLTLYAKWIRIEYSINYELDGGTNGNNPSVYDVTSNITLTNPTKEGYTFMGWYDNAEFSGNIETVIVLGTIGNLTLYAKWIINHYTITFAIVNHDPLSYITLNLGETIDKVSLGFRHSSALTSSGRVFVWGNNLSGQLGNDTTTDQLVPTEITSRFSLGSGEQIIQVSLGGFHSSALTSLGRVFTWGRNNYGQLGDNTTTDQLVPTEITSRFSLGSGEQIIQVSLGGYHSSALTSLGRVFTWGRNYSGQLGDMTAVDKLVPTEITSRFNLDYGDQIIQVSLGGYHSSALTSSGSLFMWGYNDWGQLGDMTAIDKLVPTEITSRFSLDSGDQIIQASLGTFHSSALTSSGRLFMWGRNNYGQLGNDTISSRFVPTEMTSRFSLDNGDQIIQVSLGTYHSSTLTSSGRLFMWGFNSCSSQLGDNTTTDKLVPTEITNRFSLGSENQIIQVSLGGYHSSALTSSGNLLMWGNNDSSQLGEALPYWIETYDTVIYDFNQNTLELIPVLSGYTFNGWYTDASLTTPYTFTTMPPNNITLYGKWTAN